MVRRREWCSVDVCLATPTYLHTCPCQEQPSASRFSETDVDVGLKTSEVLSLKLGP